MTRVEKAKAALWGQLIDSGEQKEEEANELLDSLITAAREEQKCEYNKLLEDDNYLRHYNNALIEQINKLNEEILAAREEGAEHEGEVPPITNANNEKPETSANNPHEPRKGK